MSPNSQADAGRPALPDALRRPLQGGKELHEAKRSEADGATTSFPLLLVAICLTVYASLYPFADWRDQGISPLNFLFAPWPRYWTGFDVGINLAGYAPLGFLLVLAALRSARIKWAVSAAVLAAALLSLCMEALQSYLPSRVPSNVDWLLNTAGAWVGGCTAWLLEKIGALQRWSRFRDRWFALDAGGALALLVLWPVALLFPASVPMGLGQVFERLELALAEALADTPFLDWLPVRDIELQPLVPGAELLCVALGALIPCLLAYGVIRAVWQRAVFALLMLTAGLAASGLSAALSYGPEHAWAWLDAPVRAGVVLAALHPF
jgi:VanZ family protein